MGYWYGFNSICSQRLMTIFTTVGPIAINFSTCVHTEVCRLVVHRRGQTLVGIELLKNQATNYNFSRQKSLKPVLLLGHYGYLRIRCYIHEGQTKAFFFAGWRYDLLNPKKVWSRSAQRHTIHLPFCCDR